MSNVLVHARCVQLDTRSVETLRKLAKSGELLHKQVAVLQVLVSSESEDPSSARPSNETVFAVLNVSLSDTPASAAADVAAQALHECLGASVPVPEVTTLDANASVNLPEPVTSNSPASRLQEAARQGAQRTQEAWQSLDSRFGITQKFERAQEQARAQFQELQSEETQQRLRQDGQRVGDALSQFGKDAADTVKRATQRTGGNSSTRGV